LGCRATTIERFNTGLGFDSLSLRLDWVENSLDCQRFWSFLAEGANALCLDQFSVVGVSLNKRIHCVPETRNQRFCPTAIKLALSDIYFTAKGFGISPKINFSVKDGL